MGLGSVLMSTSTRAQTDLTEAPDAARPAPRPARGPAHSRDRRVGWLGRPLLRFELTVRGLVILLVVVLAGPAILIVSSGRGGRAAAHPAARPAPAPSLAPATRAGGAILGPGGPAPLFPEDVSDPYVVRLGTTYYLFASEPWQEFTNVPVWVSQDLVHWRGLGEVLPQLPAWAMQGRTWAPSILVLPHSYVMYFTAAQRSSNRQCIGTATATSITGPYVASPQVLECQLAVHHGSIDGEIFVDNDGTPYLQWKSDDNAVHKPSTLWAQRLTPDGLHLIGTPVAMLRDDKKWEAYTIEAPAMVYEAGQYWLFYSGDYLQAASYAIGYALCAGPLGPCAKQTVAAPWYASGPEGLGPGEESFFHDDKGNTYMAYNAWPTAGVGYSHGYVRYAHIELVRFQHSAPPTVSPAAVAVAVSPLRGYYVLTADGMVWPEGGAISFGHADIPGGLARAIAVMPDGLGYAVLDGHGGLHLFGTARLLPVNPTIHWRGVDIARAIAITPSGRGYAVLDGLGGIHAVGDAAPAPPGAPAKGDVARSLVISPSGRGYAVMDADGTVLVSGDMPAVLERPAGNVAPDVSMTMAPSGDGLALMDSNGDVLTDGAVPPAPRGEPTYLGAMGQWAGVALLPNGHYVAVRTDSSVTVW